MMDWRSTLIRTLHLLMTGLFGYAAFVQHNDPDWWVWMSLYAAATILTAQAAWRRPSPRAVGALAALSAGFAVRFTPPALRQASWLDSEEGREALGLYLVAFWMIVVWFDHRVGHARERSFVVRAGAEHADPTTRAKGSR